MEGYLLPFHFRKPFSISAWFLIWHFANKPAISLIINSIFAHRFFGMSFGIRPANQNQTYGHTHRSSITHRGLDLFRPLLLGQRPI